MYPFLKRYFIREGFSFVDDNKEVKGGGEIITLSDDVAASHAHKLELVPETDPDPAPVPAVAPAPVPVPEAAPEAAPIPEPTASAEAAPEAAPDADALAAQA